MRHFFLGLFLLGAAFLRPLQAQDNVLKLNLPNLVSQHVALHFEHAFNDRLSIGVIGGFTPNRNLPGSDLILGIFLEDPANSGFDFQGNYTKFALTPELRYYFLKKKEAPEGPYAALAVRYARHAFDLPFELTDASNPLTVDLDARIHVIGPTLSLGWQLFWVERISLDLYFGGGLAAAPIRLKASSNVLTSDDYIRIRDSILDEIGLNVNPERLEKWLGSQGLNMGFVLPLPLVRTGLSLGYRF